MSVVDPRGRKVLLPRRGAGPFWDAVREGYAGEDRAAWQRLAMFALREAAGWDTRTIAGAFGRNEKHVARCVSDVKRDLKARFRLADRRRRGPAR